MTAVSCPFAACLQIQYFVFSIPSHYAAEDSNKISLSLLLVRLNKLSSPSLSLYVMYFSHLMTLVAVHWTCSSKSVSSVLWRPKLGTVLQMQSHQCQREANDHSAWSAGYALANTAYLALLPIFATSSCTYQGTRLYFPQKHSMSADELNSIYNAHWRHLFSVCPLQTFSRQSSHGHTDECIQAADEQIKLLMEIRRAGQERSASRWQCLFSHWWVCLSEVSLVTAVYIKT